MNWSYGITCVPSRFQDTLPRTVTSLSTAGFDKPVFFIDGFPKAADGPYPECTRGVPCVVRPLGLGAFGNFVLGMWELYIREPNADRYAMFQDDIVTCRNLRKYLEVSPYPKFGYLNLYTSGSNSKQNMLGWSLSDQWGRGALALVFDNETMRLLLANKTFVDHRRNAHIGRKGIDKACMEAMKSIGRQEWIHNPSLVDHTGVAMSACGNKGSLYSTSPCFQGEDFDVMALKETEE